MVSAGADRLARTAIERGVQVAQKTYRVRPPVVREALEIFGILGSSLTVDRRDEFLLSEILEKWWSRDLYRAWSEEGSTERIRVLREVLLRGTPLWTPPPDGERDPELEAADLTDASSSFLWHDALAVCCDAWRMDPWATYTEVPFPFFLAMLQEAQKVIAQRQLRAIEAAGVPHMGKHAAKVIDRLSRQAKSGGGEGKPEAVSREEVEKDRAELRELFGVPPAPETEAEA